MTPERLKHGQDFLAAMHKAMENIDDVRASVDEYSDTHDYPPLCASFLSRRESIDKEKMRKMEDLVYFMTRALFGRDCDNDPVVSFQMVHLGTHEDFLPSWRVPVIDDYDAPLEDRLRSVELVQNILDNVKEKLRWKKKGIDTDVKAIIKRDAIRSAAKHCSVCKKKGWVESTAKVYEDNTYGVYCEGWGIGASRTGPYRVPCECQSDRNINGWSK